jgi:hypothetical protein
MAGLLIFFQGSQKPAPPPVDPVSWKPRYQGGALELAVNVALLALASATAPLLIEPTFYKHPAPQIDLAPNVAALAQPPAQTVQPGPPEPVFTKRWPLQIDLPPNIAVNYQTAVVQSPLDLPLARKAAGQSDLYPNLAATAIQPPAYSPPPLVDQFFARRWPALDLTPNVAISTPATAQTLPTFVEPTFYRRIAQPPDLPRNVAVKFQTVRTFSTADLVPGRPARLQPDLYPNLALAPAAPRGQLIDPWLAKRLWTQPDVYPNRAIYATPVTFILPAFDQPPRYKPALLQLDLAPNLAVRQPAPPVVLIPNLCKLVYLQTRAFTAGLPSRPFIVYEPPRSAQSLPARAFIAYLPPRVFTTYWLC